MRKTSLCTPLFDQLPFIETQYPPEGGPQFLQRDFKAAQAFILSYRHNAATFSAYRRETERFLQWAFYVHQISILDCKGSDIEAYLKFCQKPPMSWIGIKKAPRFLFQQTKRIPNPVWRPFIATVSKAGARQGQQPNRAHYLLSRKSLREIFTIIGSLYQFLIQAQQTDLNPTKQVRQKSYYFESQQYQSPIRRLSDLQWDYVIETAEIMANHSKIHERTLFIITLLYGLYLRVSELTASTRWTPTMGDFIQDNEGWWFRTVGKGNKRRDITVSEDVLAALKRYRLSRGLTHLPSPQESMPLILKQRGQGPISSTSQIRIIVQQCFDQAIQRLKQDQFIEEADALLQATVHWLRHTGISDDVKYRPREHVRDDAGHSSKIIDTYLDITRQERQTSGKKKRIRPT